MLTHETSFLTRTLIKLRDRRSEFLSYLRKPATSERREIFECVADKEKRFILLGKLKFIDNNFSQPPSPGWNNTKGPRAH